MQIAKDWIDRRGGGVFSETFRISSLGAHPWTCWRNTYRRLLVGAFIRVTWDKLRMSEKLRACVEGHFSICSLCTTDRVHNSFLSDFTT